MTNPLIKIVNASTGEEIEREMTALELAQWNKDLDEAQADKEKAAQKATAKTALLDRLGITEDEARLLLG